MPLPIQRLNLDPVTGDNPSEAFMKLDIDVGLIADAVDNLGGAGALNVGTSSGTVAAGDDPRFGVTGLKNKIINGNFDFWQRGTSLANGIWFAFLADRWLTNCGATGGTQCAVRTVFFTN